MTIALGLELPNQSGEVRPRPVLLCTEFPATRENSA